MQRVYKYRRLVCILVLQPQHIGPMKYNNIYHSHRGQPVKWRIIRTQAMKRHNPYYTLSSHQEYKHFFSAPSFDRLLQHNKWCVFSTQIDHFFPMENDFVAHQWWAAKVKGNWHTSWKKESTVRRLKPCCFCACKKRAIRKQYNSILWMPAIQNYEFATIFASGRIWLKQNVFITLLFVWFKSINLTRKALQSSINNNKNV